MYLIKNPDQLSRTVNTWLHTSSVFLLLCFIFNKLKLEDICVYKSCVE